MFNKEFTENRGLSPVIGVVLLVALTVILVAVVGGFVTDFGSGVESAPNAQIGVDFDTGNTNITLSHDGGADLNPETLEFEYEKDGGSTQTAPLNDVATETEDGLIQAGDEVVVDTSNFNTSVTIESGDTARIIWSGESGNNREVLLEEIVP